MTRPVTVTLDVEDLRASAEPEDRTVRMTEQVLDLFGRFEVRASVFVVGDVAERHPSLIRRIARDGHELGLHAHAHIPMASIPPERFHNATAGARAQLQDLSGQEVSGYRAPMMSLVPLSAWTIPILAELGFRYSSSVLPAPSPLYGWPGLPRRPFRWSDGLIEFPCPLVRFPGVDLPYLGGTYIRLLPDIVRRIGLRRATSSEVLWTYCHPWEFDTHEPYHTLPHIGRLASRIAWLGRSRMADRMGRVLTNPIGAPLGRIASGLASTDLPVVDPGAPPNLGPMARWADGRLRER